MQKTYQLWEIMKDGKHGEIYEITKAALAGYIGKQVQVYCEDDFGKEYKALVKPNSTGNEEANLVRLYGVYGTATYIKKNVYTPISAEKALEKLNDFKEVFVKKDGQYVEFSRYSSFSYYDIHDVSDLMGTTFYLEGK